MCVGSDECDCHLEDDDDGEQDWDDEDPEGTHFIDGVGFADPGGRSALRAATADNPRVYPCPTCGTPNRLTAIDVQHGYCCDECADRIETGF